MRTFPCAIVIIVAALATGCATKPASIQPAYVSELLYVNFTCEQLADEYQRTATALVKAAEAQHKARAGDTVGVIFLGLPTSSLSGNNLAAEIARLKGEVEAIRRACVAKGCELPPPVEVR